jgi:hypothetical protein
MAVYRHREYFFLVFLFRAVLASFRRFQRVGVPQFNVGAETRQPVFERGALCGNLLLSRGV